MATSDRGAKRVLGKRKAGQHPAAGAPKPKERTLAPARAVCEPEATSAPNSDSAEDEQHGDEEEEYVPGTDELVTKEALEEEARLAAEREAAGDEGGTTEHLKRGQFDKLTDLLDRSQMYTEFLGERMTEIEEADKKKGKAKAMSEAAIAKEQKRLMPTLTGGKLREYQLKGVKWMIALWQNGMNGILADQMGLGKTLQTIAFLSHLKENNVHAPYLIIGPLSTVSNWVNEIKRFAPTFNVTLFHGTKDERMDIKAELCGLNDVSFGAGRRKSGGEDMHTIKDGPTFPIIVTSYEMAICEVNFLRRFSWKYIVVDEGHRLKNKDCRLFKELSSLDTQNKLLLTGTPLQNNLKELWSLLNFILPDVFGNLTDFESWFDFNASSADEQRDMVVKKLHSLLRPFLLRRLKSEVKGLPKKQEIILYAHMAPMQTKFNKALIEKTLDAVMRQKQSCYNKSQLASLRNTLMQLRKNSNHPDLVQAPFEQDPNFPPVEVLLEQSGKLQLMDRLMQRMKSGGHKVLVFSQMTKMLDLLGYFLEEQGFQTFRIDGSVPQAERQERIDRFNTDKEHGVFLLSTRAGGLGINLTAADTVIIYDSDWNPHADMQAMDRCHRIGQTKPVHVYRLATANSVDGKMLSRAKDKLKLEKIVITKGNFRQDYDDQKKAITASKEEIIDLLKPDSDEGEALANSGVVDDKMLERICNREDLLDGYKGDKLPSVGVGYRIPEADTGANLLSGVNN